MAGSFLNWLAVGLGAAIGAWCRWHLGLRLNHLHALLPLGTLVANIAGGYAIGLLVGVFQTHSGLPDAWRLFLITGLLGGLTTFSTFSAEAMMLMQRGQLGWMLLHAFLHVLGSMLFCWLGFVSWSLAGK